MSSKEKKNKLLDKMVGGLSGGKTKSRGGFGPPVNLSRPQSLGDFN